MTLENVMKISKTITMAAMSAPLVVRILDGFDVEIDDEVRFWIDIASPVVAGLGGISCGMANEQMKLSYLVDNKNQYMETIFSKGHFKNKTKCSIISVSEDILLKDPEKFANVVKNSLHHPV